MWKGFWHLEPRPEPSICFCIVKCKNIKPNLMILALNGWKSWFESCLGISFDRVVSPRISLGNLLIEAFISFPQFYQHVGEISATVRCDSNPTTYSNFKVRASAMLRVIWVYTGSTWTTFSFFLEANLQLVKAAGFMSVVQGVSSQQSR